MAIEGHGRTTKSPENLKIDSRLWLEKLNFLRHWIRAQKDNANTHRTLAVIQIIWIMKYSMDLMLAVTVVLEVTEIQTLKKVLACEIRRVGGGDSLLHLNSEQYVLHTHTSIEETELKLLSLNVCGIRSKLNYPEFINLINSYDIVGVQETKTDELDTVDIPGYKAFLNNRSCISRSRSGGIGLIVKEWLLPSMKVHDIKATDLAIDFTLSEVLYRDGMYDGLMGAVVYIPPYGSRYASEDPFLEIQGALFKFCSKR